MVAEAGPSTEPQATDSHAPARSTLVLAALANAPQRLLLCLLWFSYVAAAAYVTGLFRPIVVIPVALVVIAVTWRFHPGQEADARGSCQRVWLPAAAAALALAVAAAWFLLNLPFLSESVLVDRDPDVYTLTALWLFDHPSPSIPVSELSSNNPGFGLVGSALRPQGYHLVSGLAASAGWLFGEEAVFWGNLACGGAALLGLYLLGTRVLGPLWALVPMLALAASMPMLEFSRVLYSEPIAMTFTLLGTALLWDAWKRDRVGEYLVAGMAYGGAALARIDGTLPLLGVLVGITVASFLRAGRNDSRHRWAAPLVLLGALPGVLLGLADGLLHSGTYVFDLSDQLVLLLAALATSASISLAGALVPVPTHRLAGIGRGLRFAATAGAVLTAVLFVILASRPWWYVSRGSVDNGIIRGIQEREGVPVEGTRLYSEQSLEWISWYYGWPVVVVGLAGLLAWLPIGSRPNSTRLLLFSALFLPSAVLYLTAPTITPDQIWAMRRFLPVVIPGLLLATVWVARGLVSRGRARGGPARHGGVLVAVALVVTVVGWPLTTVHGMWTERNDAGSLSGMRDVCTEIDGRPTVVAGHGNFLAAVLVLCDVPAVSIREPTKRLLVEAREELGDDLFLVTHAPSVVPWNGAAPEPLTFTRRVWEQSLIGPPDEVFEKPEALSMGIIRPDGTVEPVQP